MVMTGCQENKSRRMYKKNCSLAITAELGSCVKVEVDVLGSRP